MLENSGKYNFAEILNPRNPLGLNTSYNGSAEKIQNPHVGRPGRSTDLPILQYRSTGPVDWKKPESWGLSVKGFRSTGPVDRANPRVGVCQSEPCGRPAGRPRPFLCMLCTSVDRAGRPTACLLLLLLFPVAVPLPFVVDFRGDLRQHFGNLLQHLAWHQLL